MPQLLYVAVYKDDYTYSHHALMVLQHTPTRTSSKHILCSILLTIAIRYFSVKELSTPVLLYKKTSVLAYCIMCG